MAYGNLHRANFMEHLAPSGKISGTELRPVDQCAMAIRLERQQECREERKTGSGYSFYGPSRTFADYEERARQNGILDRADQKRHRGGMNMRPEDGLENPPGKYLRTFADMRNASEAIREK